MNINNNPQIPYGNDGTQPIGQNPNILRDYLEVEIVNSKKAIDDGRPSINPQPYYPDSYYGAGTILSDQYFNYSSDGIQEVTSASVNSTDEWERQARQADLDATRGRTIYNSSVVGTKSVAPNVEDGGRITNEGLLKAQREAQINSLTNKINRYQQELTVFQMKVINAEIGLKKAKDQLSELEDS